MHLSTWLTTVFLLPTTTLAFYPLPSQNDQSSGTSEHGNKDRRFFTWLSEHDLSSGDGDVPTLSIKKGSTPKTKRNNAFPVVLSSQPTMKNSVAIDEDGSDLSYFASVAFGSSGKKMYMLLDTGAGNTWVFGDQCTSSTCQQHNTFGTAESNTLNITSTPWNVSYGTGTVSGYDASDKVSFADFNVELDFGLATNASDTFNTYPMDGILGLGRPGSDKLGTPTVMQALDSANLIQANMFGVHLQRNADGATDGELNFGAPDSSRFDGSLSYTDTLVSGGLWEIPADDAGVGGTGGKFTNRSAIIDTGTSYILMPKGDAQTLHALFPGSTQNGENFMIPCDATAPLQFTFSGVAYNVSSKDYLGKSDGSSNMCASNIVGHQAFGPTSWLLGDVFLKNVYTVFDFDKNRIGFGVKNGTNNTSQNSTTISSNSTASEGVSTASSTATATGKTSGTASAPSTKATATSTGGTNLGLGSAASHHLPTGIFSFIITALTFVFVGILI